MVVNGKVQITYVEVTAAFLPLLPLIAKQMAAWLLLFLT